ncbi:DUF982 domain-containing protein [Neorhizobium sp. P12A]|uniref:DUF982 domain-containing protein n=1 Tax=Rhizobium/Agrobacterium group TaxID=227290 RepID=UPI001047B3F6|nr:MULTISPECIES: DUF982 domain-containing protein [Rhizobium/Agrobacterium group]KAA0695597.1 DUF982 domain-containing protein [Neorhizobium sp. P12A]TCR64340.1 uncharacterized protein DUF982 [Rhizobium sp. BK376]
MRNTQIINLEFHVLWRSPVFVRMGKGPRERVDGPDVALGILLRRWPETSSRQYLEAKRRCLDALVRHGSAEVARERFVEAAIATRIFA